MTKENKELVEALTEARRDIDYVCTAIMKLHEHKGRARLKETLNKIDAALAQHSSRNAA